MTHLLCILENPIPLVLELLGSTSHPKNAHDPRIMEKIEYITDVVGSYV